MNFKSKILKVLKPLVGPLIAEANKEIFTDNKFFIWEIVKNVIGNLTYGFINFVYDSFAWLLKATYKDLLLGIFVHVN